MGAQGERPLFQRCPAEMEDDRTHLPVKQRAPKPLTCCSKTFSSMGPMIKPSDRKRLTGSGEDLLFLSRAPAHLLSRLPSSPSPALWSRHPYERQEGRRKEMRGGREETAGRVWRGAKTFFRKSLSKVTSLRTKLRADALEEAPGPKVLCTETFPHSINRMSSDC